MIMLVALILSSSLVLLVAREWRRVTDPAVTFDEGFSRQTDLFAYLLPPIYHSLVGPYAFPLYYERFETDTKYMPYLGYTLLGLTLASLRSRQIENRVWLLSTVLWVVPAAGSILRVNGTLYPQALLPSHLPGDAYSGEAGPVTALGLALRALETSGVRYILLHKSNLDADLDAHFQRLLPLLPIYEDSTLILITYDITHQLPVYCDGFPTPLTPDVDLARFDIQYDSVGMEWQLQVLAILLRERVTPLTCQIRLIGENRNAFETPLTIFEALPEKKGDWAVEDLAMQEIMLSRSPTLEPREYRRIMTCPEESAHYTAPRTLYVSHEGHIAYLRRSLNLRYGDAIQLCGYRWRTEGTNLLVNILWKALNSVDNEYKVFVHLLNAKEELVRQYDAIPCNWQCPTSHWEAGDIVSDIAAISLQGLPAGEYHPAVELYYSATQERLPARGRDNELYPNAYFVLPDIFLISDNDR